MVLHPHDGANSDSTDARGVYGAALNTDSQSAGVGVYGLSQAVGGTGVFGQYGATESITGQDFGPQAIGVWGDAGSGEQGYIAVFGTADDAFAGYLANNSPTGYVTFQVEAGSSESDMFYTWNDATGGFCVIGANADLDCTTGIGAVVQVDGGRRQLAVPAIASPRNWFEDAGSGQLVNGAAIITLDSDFVQTVNTEMDYKVFPVPNGDCKGLYIAHKTATSFEVRELGGGTSSVAFDYRIMALRKNYENVRFADRTAEVQKLREQNQPVHARKGSGLSHNPQRSPLLNPSSQHAELRPETIR